MPFPVLALGNVFSGLLGKFGAKIGQHGQRVARKKDQQKIASSLGVSYECVRQIQSGIYTNPNNEPWAPNRKAGESCTPKIAQQLGYDAWQAGAFDELAGKPLTQSHPELYQQLQQIDSNGSQDSRSRGVGMQDAAHEDTGISFGRQQYEARPRGPDPRYVQSALGVMGPATGAKDNPNAAIFVVLAAAAVVVVFAFTGRGHR